MIVITKAGKPIHACLTEEDAAKYLTDIEAEAVEDHNRMEKSLQLPIVRYNSLWLDVCPNEYKCYSVTSNVTVPHDY